MALFHDGGSDRACQNLSIAVRALSLSLQCIFYTFRLDYHKRDSCRGKADERKCIGERTALQGSALEGGRQPGPALAPLTRLSDEEAARLT